MRPIKSRRTVFILITIVSGIFLLSACSGGDGSSGDSTYDTGSLNFHVVYHETKGRSQPQAAVMDCAGLSVATVEAAVYDENDAFLAGGGPWNCDVGQGTIASVSAGVDRTVAVFGKEADGNIIFSGEKSGIQVDANRENDAGSIDCHAFIPSLQTPLEGSVVDVGAMDLGWDDVAGAAKYRVVVSENGDLSDPVVIDTTTAATYSPSGLSNTETYYWQVFAIDSDGNSGAGSQIWSFNGSEAFVASLQAPPDESVVNVGSVDLKWDDVSGAAEYQVIISENSGLANPIIEDTSTTSTYTPSGLSNTMIYYWQVFAIDSDGNSGSGSAIWSFFDRNAFVPNLQAPADGSKAEVEAIELNWDSLTGAVEYQVVISENSDLSNPIIDAAAAISSYAPSGLAFGETYYWQIFAIDGYGNKGIGSETWSFDTESLVPVKLRIGDNSTDDFPVRFFIEEIWEGHNNNGYDTDLSTLTIGDSMGKPSPTDCTDGFSSVNLSGVLIVDTVDLAHHAIADRGNSDIRLNLYISESNTSGIVELHSLVDKPTIPGVTGCRASVKVPWTIPKADKLLATANVTGDSTGYVEFSSSELDDYVTDNKGGMLYFILRKPDGVYQVSFYMPIAKVSGTRPFLEIDTIPQQ